MQILDVLIQHPTYHLDRTFSYLYDGKEKAEVGFRVIISFNHQRIMGFVSKVRETNASVEEIDKAFGFHVAYIESLYDKEPLLNNELLTLVDEVSSYYLSPKVSVLQAMLPSSLKPAISATKGPKIAYEDWLSLPEDIDIDSLHVTDKQRELLLLVLRNGEIRKKEAGHPSIVKTLVEGNYLVLTKKERNRLLIPEYEKEQPHVLNPEQQSAFEKILSYGGEVFLLQGITGSGKTEVYLHLTEEYLKKGKNVLMLVPEISLTPIMVEYFSRRFEGNIAILHSELTPAEKYDEYRRIARGEARIVVGARSAVFAPLENIGLIIIDEEHVSSYKQDSVPHYHAREVAIMRARHFGAKVLLGSATPSLESKARAAKGVYGYAEMNVRASSKASLPKTFIIDLGEPKATSYQPLNLTREDGEPITKPNAIFSKLLFFKIKEKLEKKEQVILLINRRGYSSFLTCGKCGHIFTCPSCHSNLSYHRIDEMLKCHHCGFVMRYPEVCPECGSPKIQRVGFGTERLVKVLNEQFPEAKVGRLDSDVTKVRNNLSKVLGQFRKGEFDILVGTQMIAKGHDFPNVTLVGVVLADIGLTLPSYRAAETTFELITQAVGRSGRADKPGEAYIQTYNPAHYAITFGAKQDYEGF
ncbi:MAG: primosomal protein N', partial [Bacilli bacterium]|nr:primosomal protein N' [Bacilli bacterium]